MSSEKGNVKKSGPPRHKNNSAFRNNLHDNGIKQKMINSLEITGLCASCTRVIEWKIKYKKYKPLTNPKACTSCSEKSIRRAYHLFCQQCAEDKQICPKCGNKRVVAKKKNEVKNSECADRCSSECSDNATQESGHHIKLEPVSTEKTTSSNLSEDQNNSLDDDDDDDEKGHHTPVNLSLANLSVSN